MRHITFPLLSLILWAALSCSKQHSDYQIPTQEVAASPVPNDTTRGNYALSEWSAIPGGYRCILTLSDEFQYPSIYFNDSGKTIQLTDTPIGYLGGQLSYQNHSGEKVVYFYVDGSLPFEVLWIEVE
jgi:hypothetical protein